MGKSEGRVAVRGDDDGSVREALSAAGVELAAADAGGSTDGTRAIESVDATGDSDVIVAVGDAALRETVVDRDGPRSPVVPVGDRQHAIAPEDVPGCVRRLLDGAAAESGDRGRNRSMSSPIRRVALPVLTIEADGEPVRHAAFDVAFVTAEPARISEYAVGLDETGRETFRADGVVVATPLGSDGYAAAVGGSVVEPGGGISVVPISPFATRAETWVAASRVSVSIERESESVALVVDGRRRTLVEPHRTVEIEAVDAVEAVLATGAGAGRGRDDRKHSNNS
jgi:NAD+ kinase